MFTVTLFLFSALNLLLFATATTQNPPPYKPTDSLLLNCGASSQATSPDGRKWDGDSLSKFRASNSQTASSVFQASKQDPSVTQVPYMTARIIHSKFTYMFPVLPGPKFIRLYFYPATYSGFNTSTSFFTVTANSYTLLSNFSAYLTVSAMRPSVASFVKEFIITVWDKQELNITFTPSPTSFAFINGIEIVSMPNNMYTKEMDDAYNFVNTDIFFSFDNTTSLETVYRLNVGGGLVANTDDTGMFRTWLDDTEYIFTRAIGTPHKSDATIKYTNETPAYIAPPVVYQTKRTMGPYPEVNQNYNLTWQFLVDSGFNYLVRLHFCETEEFITRVNQRVFFIFINNMTAEDEADVMYWSGGLDIPVYKDYVVSVPSGSRKQELWLGLRPNMGVHPKYADAILNGLEIFKLNNSDGSLAGFNPELVDLAPPEPQSILQERTKSKRLSISLVVAIVGAVIGFVFAFSLIVCFFVSKHKRKVKGFEKSEGKSYWVSPSFTDRANTTNTSLIPTDLCHRFTITEIKAATGNFDDQNIIGCGGFGSVYKGFIDHGSIPVAIKRLDSSSKQGTTEFQTEIEMLSQLRHLHLVSLIGYCDDEGEMILVYEYMSHGTLRDHLYKTKSSPFSWKQRLEICIGAAKGLHYLHSGAKHTIIHRDVKSTNILLDENWVAKVSDFGLSKVGPTSMSQTHVSTVVRGSIGYVDPDYYRRQQLTEKSDVYSFGVVLFEVLSGRAPVRVDLPKEQVSLAEWAKNCYGRGTLDQIIDPYLKGDIALVSLKKFGEIAHSCLHDHGIHRPKMSDVVWGLEFALQLQQSAEKNISHGDRVGEDTENPLLPRGEVVSTDDDDLFTGSGGPLSYSRSTVSTGEGSVTRNEVDRTRSEAVFSELMYPKGR